MRLYELNESMGISTAGFRQKGFNVTEMLYHGSFWDFDEFTTRHEGTSKYLFTSPQRNFADEYGRYLYTCFGRQDKQVDLRSNGKVVEKLVRAHLDTFLERYRHQIKSTREQGRKDEAFRLGVKCFKQGSLYSGHDGLQDDILRECFSLGYTSVRMFDVRPGISVIFKNREDVVIVKKEVDGQIFQPKG